MRFKEELIALIAPRPYAEPFRSKLPYPTFIPT